MSRVVRTTTTELIRKARKDAGEPAHGAPVPSYRFSNGRTFMQEPWPRAYGWTADIHRDEQHLIAPGGAHVVTSQDEFITV